MRFNKPKITAFVLTLALAFILCVPAIAVDKATVQSYVTESAANMVKTLKNPQVGSIGGEWAIIGLARSGYDVPKEYYQNYYATLERYVKDCKGVLHTKKYTEYSRVILALTAIGKDPRNVGGYNLLTPLGDFDKTIWQGINGPIWALIALDSGNYDMPQNPEAATQATRQLYIDEILSRQLADGGWSLTGKGGDKGPSDPDITGMALQALAKYQDQEPVKKATEEALACMSKQQDADGGFSSWGTGNSESAVQMLVALCELGLPIDDSRFVKNGKTILDNLLTYRNKTAASSTPKTAAETTKCLPSKRSCPGCGLRAQTGKNRLYRMSDPLRQRDFGSRERHQPAGKHQTWCFGPAPAPADDATLPPSRY